MDDKNFDKHLQSVLENLEPQYDPGSWAVLQQRMDAAHLEEPDVVDAVDKAVYHKLERLESPYQAAHWQLLAQRLQMQTNRLRHLRLAKCAELAILLLFIWNFPILFESDVQEKRDVSPLRPDVPVAQAGGTGNGYHATSGYSMQFAATGTGYRHAVDGALQKMLAAPGTTSLLSNDYRRAASVTEILIDLDNLGQNAKPPIASLDLLQADVLAALASPNRLVNMPIVPVNQPQKAGPFYVSAMAGFDQNRVLVNGVRKQSSGHGGAMAIGFRPGKWGVETGVGYVRKSFIPKREVEIYSGNLTTGYFGSTPTEVQADIITVPVKATRKIAQVGKATLHATGGLTGHFTAHKTFDYGTVYYAPIDLPPNFLPDPNHVPQNQKTGRGLLEQGRFDENFYATIDAGIRIEHPIAGKRYTAFIEPAIRQSITGKGFGPNREPVNTFSIQAGVMAFL